MFASSFEAPGGACLGSTACHGPTLRRAQRTRAGERGVAMIWATLGTFLILGLVASGASQLKSLQDATGVEFAVEGQARQVAESGLVCALAWMRRQATQPVTVFAPKRDMTADPVVDETDDPTVGLVRSFEIAPGYWGRFTVRAGKAAEPFVDANKNGIYDAGEKVQDLNGDKIRSPAWGTRDVTTVRGLTTAGLVWHLESEGCVFRRSRADKALGEDVNIRIARSVLATEVRRLNVALPGSAGLIQSRADEVDVKKGTLISSTVQAIGYRANTGSPKISAGASVTAPVKNAALPLLTATGGYMDGAVRRISVEEIFGVSMTTLRSMADVSSNTVRIKKNWKKQRLGTTIPDNSLVVYQGTVAKGNKIVFDKKFPLRGTGIVVINGDVEFKRGSASNFNGILVVLGKLTVHGPAKFTGTVIATKKSHIHGKKNDVQIIHDPSLVTRMLQELSRYRRFKTTYEPTRTLRDGRPDERSLTETRPGGGPLEATRKLAPSEILPN